jgi:hypothetical protein
LVGRRTVELQVGAYHARSAIHRQTEENKSDNLIPEGPGRLQDGGDNMFDELPPAARIQMLPHTHIVTKGGNRGFPCNVPVGNCRLLTRDALVNPGLVHYNRNGWMRTHRWNAGCLRRICY